MTLFRLWNMLRISLKRNGFQRAEYMKKKKIFAEQGENCFWQPRNIPPEAKLIKLHDNVVVASEVLFVNHDVIHHVFKHMDDTHEYPLNLGAIEIGCNVFIGSRCTVLPGTMIEDNVIIGAGSLVRGKICGGGVYAGVPVKRIGDFLDVMEKRMCDCDIRKIKTERFDETWEGFYKRYNKI